MQRNLHNPTYDIVTWSALVCWTWNFRLAFVEKFGCSRLWSMPRPASSDEAAATEHMHAVQRLGQKVAAVLMLEDLCTEGESTFMQLNNKGAILPPNDVDPNCTQQAKLAMEAARDNAEVKSWFVHLFLALHRGSMLCPLLFPPANTIVHYGWTPAPRATYVLLLCCVKPHRWYQGLQPRPDCMTLSE